MNYVFIINPKSGGKDASSRLVQQIEARFATERAGKYEIVFTEFAGHARQLAEEAVKNKAQIVVAAGGDGTVNEVCSALVSSHTAFGLIPMGSGNGFARSLKIPLNPAEAIQALVMPRIGHMDVGKIDNNYFFGVAGLGLDAQIGARFQEFGIRGPLPYFYIGFREYFKYSYEEFTIISAEQNITVQPLLITIANTNQYGNGAVIAPHADFSDGLFDVCIIGKLNLLQGFCKFHSLFNNKIDKQSFYTCFRTDRLKIIRSKGPGLFHTDGEPRMGGKELVIELVKGALKVCQ